jgi:hypothetical protein
MALTFERGGQLYEIAGDARAPAGLGSARTRLSPRYEGARVRLDPHGARSLLGGTLGHGRDMGELRRLLGARAGVEVVSRMSDAEVVDQIARRIASHELRVYGMTAPRRSYFFKAPDAVDDAVGPQDVVEEEVFDASVDAEAVPEASESDSVDAAAQAATLRAAARDGTPFCEECEKARPAKNAEAAPAPAPAPAPAGGAA